MKALTFCELDIPVCSLTYSVAPCTAGGNSPADIPCHNTNFTCQDLPHYTETTVTLRFSIGADYLPRDIEAIPCILGVEYNPGSVGLDGTLGVRTSINIALRDHKHPDTGPGFDKYYSERSYDPYEQGTIFGKLRARQPYLKGKALRCYYGERGEQLAAMEVRHFVVDSVNGPDESGVFTITAKDILKLLDGELAQYPVMNTGYLSADIDEDDTELTLLPVGIGNLEYPVSGYLNLGGNEIVAFARDISAGNDANTLLLLHMEGVVGQGATNAEWVDSSSHNRSATRISTPTFAAFDKFGDTGLFAPSDDGLSYADSNDWDLTSNKTIDGWFAPSILANSDRLFSHANSDTVGYRLMWNADGSLDFTLNNTSTLVQLTAPAGTVTVGSPSLIYYHIAVERFGNVWTLYVNGVIKDQDTVNPSYPSITGLFRVGTGSGGNNGIIGYVDEFRISNVARYSGVAFTPPVLAYQASSDVAGITRAQLNTTASSHQQEDRAQVVGIIAAQSPADIIETLEVDYAGVLQSYIPSSDWDAEIATYLGQVYSAVVPEPTSVKQLIEELNESAGLAHWWNDVTQLLELRVIRGVALNAETFGSSDRLPETLTVRDQPEKQVTRVQVYYGQIDATKGVDDLQNFRGMVETADEDAEANYGYQKIRQIKSRWIPQFGAAIATTLAELILARYVAAPRKFTFTTQRTDSGIVPILGEGYQLSAWFLQDEFGAEVEAPFQVTRLRPDSALIEVEAEEMLLDPVAPSDPNDHTIIIASSVNDFNLKTAHDAIYPAAGPDTVVTCRINAGAIVGASSSFSFAFDTGSGWDAGAEIILDIRGGIQGAGGAGGRGTKVTSNASSVTSLIPAAAGQAGGTALKVRRAISIDGNGTIKAPGGGGGGGGATAVANTTKYGGAGAGGAGKVGGPGADAWRDTENDGGDGTATAPGAGAAGSGGGDNGEGGDGGAHATAGSAGETVGGGLFDERDGGAAGAAGKAIDGNAFVTEIGTVTITGTRI